MTTLRVRGLVVERSGREVLTGVDLDVAGGELVVLAGPNGVGKSTLLASVAGDLAPRAGEVLLDGAPVASRSLEDLARLRAVVRQGSRVASNLEVLEVVRLGRLPHGDVDAPSGERAARRALEAVGLGDLAGRRIDELSGGQEQGVHLARALAQVGQGALEGGPASGALFLDEPIAALDLARQIEFLDRLRALARSGLAVLVVLHDLDHAARVADRIVVLQGGRVAAAGPPLEVLDPGLLARVFGVKAHIQDAPWSPGRPWIGIEGPLPACRPAGAPGAGPRKK